MMSSDSSFPTPACARAELCAITPSMNIPAAERRAMEQHLAGCARLRARTGPAAVDDGGAAHAAGPRDSAAHRVCFGSSVRAVAVWRWLEFWNSGRGSALLRPACWLLPWWFRPGMWPRLIVPMKCVGLVKRMQRFRLLLFPKSKSMRLSPKLWRRSRVRRDARMIQSAVRESERKHDAEYRNQMVAIGENLMVLQKRLSTELRVSGFER